MKKKAKTQERKRTLRPKAPTLDMDRFASRLAKALAAVLVRKRAQLASKTLDCVALDVHPWDGVLNVAIRHELDEEPRVSDSRILVADWELSRFACANEDPAEVCAWPEATTLARSMKVAFDQKPAAMADADFAAKIYLACAAAAKEGSVWAVLDGLARVPTFRIAVSDVDHPSASVFVADPRAGAAGKGTRMRAKPRGS